MEQSMKRTLVWCVVAMLSLMVAAQAQDKMSGGTEQAVAALEQKWIDATKASNPRFSRLFWRISSSTPTPAEGHEQSRDAGVCPGGKA